MESDSIKSELLYDLSPFVLVTEQKDLLSGSKINSVGLTAVKLYRPQGLNPVVDQREELPILPFGNPIGIVPAASRGVS